MIVFLDKEGNVITSSPEHIGRNSNDASIIYIVGYIPEAATVYMTFTLPNGKTLFGGLAGQASGDQIPQKASLVLATEGVTAWRYSVPSSVTALPGVVGYDIYAQSENVCVSAHGTFTVSRGNKITLPPTPPEDAWKNVSEALSRIEGDFDALFGFVGYESDTTYDKPLIQRVSALEKPGEAVDLGAEGPVSGDAVSKAVLKVQSDLMYLMNAPAGLIKKGGQLPVSGGLIYEAIEAATKDPDIQLYDPAQTKSGGYWNHNPSDDRCYILSYGGWFTTQKFPIDRTKKYMYSGITAISTNCKVTYFDEQYVDLNVGLVGGYFVPQQGENVLENIPANATHVSFSLRHDNVDSFSFVEVGKTLHDDVGVLHDDVDRLKYSVGILQGDITLDSVAWGDKTYRDIFATANLIPYGDFENELGSPAIGSGNPTITGEKYYTKNHSLKCFGDTSQQLWVKLSDHLIGGNAYYIACKVKVDRYVAGNVGFLTDLYTGSQGTCNEVNDRFRTVSRLEQTYSNTNAFNIFLGTFLSADADAYIDDFVVVDVSTVFGDTIPTKEEMDILYDEYLSIVNLSYEARVIAEMQTDIDGLNTRLDNAGVDTEYEDAECVNAFVAEMNKKAASLGMSGTHFQSPHGMVKTSYSIPQDLLKLGVVASCYQKALDIWSTPTLTKTITGEHRRTLTIENAFLNGTAEDLGAYYKVLGGKGGSLWWSSADTDQHRAQVILVDVEERPTVLSLMGIGNEAYYAIYKSAKELCDMVKAEINGEVPAEGTNLTQLVSSGGGYCACVLPPYSAAHANTYEPVELLSRKYSQGNATEASRMPASTSKIMTMLVALDYITDIHELVTIKASDITSGSGSTYYDGDVITMEDALKMMMMESSNTLANTIARIVGTIILNRGGAQR